MKKLLVSSIVMVYIVGFSISSYALEYIDNVKNEGVYYDIMKDSEGRLTALVSTNNRHLCTSTEVKVLDTLINLVRVEKIDDLAFAGNESIEKLVLGDYIQCVGESAFHDCNKLREVTLNEGLKRLEDSAFGYTAIKEVYIPSSVEFIDSLAFSPNSLLEKIEVDHHNTKYKSREGILYNYNEDTLITYPANHLNSSFVLEDNISVVKDYAFWKASNLEEITVKNRTLDLSEAALLKKIKIICYEGSKAHEYAKKEGHEYSLIHENHAPKLVKPIPDTTVKVGETFKYNVESHFTDEDGDYLRYKMLTVNSNIKFSIATKILTYIPKAEEKYAVTIVAEDGDGERVKDSFVMSAVNPLDFMELKVLDVTSDTLAIMFSATKDASYSILVKEVRDNMVGRDDYYVTGNLKAKHTIKKLLSSDRLNNKLKPNADYKVVITLKSGNEEITKKLSVKTKEKTPYTLTLDSISDVEGGEKVNICWHSNTARQFVALKNLTDNKTIGGKFYNKPIFMKWQVPESDKAITYEITVVGYDTNGNIVKTVKEQFTGKKKATPAQEEMNQINNDYLIVTEENVKIVLNEEHEQQPDKVQVEKISVEDLAISEELKAKIGEWPVYGIFAYVDGKKMDFKQDKPMTIEVPVNTDKENHQVVVIQVDEAGKMHVMEGVLKNGVMRFIAHHSSYYAIIYRDKQFADVMAHWGRAAIEALASRDIVNGVGKDKFKPDGNISRAEFVTLMVRYFNLTSDSTTNYSDVSSASWFSDYTRIAKASKILPDNYGGTFGGNHPITREEMMYILYKSLEVTNRLESLEEQGDKLSDFDDYDKVSEYAVKGSEYLISRDIINGNGEGEFKPMSTSTRAEVAQMLWNMINKAR